MTHLLAFALGITAGVVCVLSLLYKPGTWVEPYDGEGLFV